MRIQDDIKSKYSDFIDLLVSHNVEYLYAFGSSITDAFQDSKSDIDLLIEIDEPDPIKRGEKLMNLWNKFEELFNRKVDLLTSNSIRNPILRENINRTKILIYDGKGQKILI